MEDTPELSKAQQAFLKLRKLFPEDPDNIRAKSEMKKREEDKLRRLFMHKQHATKNNVELLKNARSVRNQKPKTKEG